MQDRDLDELQRIWELREKGAISEDEYLGLKTKILGQMTGSKSAEEPRSSPHVPPIHPNAPSAMDYRKGIGIGCAAILVLIIIGIVAAPSETQNSSAADTNVTTNIADAGSNLSTAASSVADSSTWSYSEDEEGSRWHDVLCPHDEY